MIGFYAGIKKPTCSNHFLERFVDEVCSLYRKGIHLNGRTYTFSIKNFIMDAPAKAYILGVKSHNAKTGCTKCRCIGVSTPRKGLASTTNQIKIGRKAVCFVNLDAPRRKHKDFYDDSLPRCDSKGGCRLQHLAEEHLNEEKIIDRGIYSADSVRFDDDDEDEDEGYYEACAQMEADNPKERHHKHWTILSRIPNLDLIVATPLDPMHLLYVGCCPKWLKIFSDSRSLLPQVLKNKASERLLQIRQYQPCEFERPPDTLDKIKLWKATQYRVFLLYIGLPVLEGLIDEKYLKHFTYLVCCARYMTKKLPSDEDDALKVKERIARIVRPLLREFVQDSITLFGPEFVTYNIHNLIHIVDDYLTFGSLEEFSAFIFENFLKDVKSYVHAGYKPRQQIVSRYSAEIRMGIHAEKAMRDVDREPIDDVAEFYEEPMLLHKDDETDILEEEEESEPQKYESFQELRLRNFKLRTDHDGDRFCLIGSRHYARVEKILRKVDSGEIFLVGKYFLNVKNSFISPVKSEDVGLVSCSHLSEMRWFSMTELNTKCYAFPIDDEEWAVAQFLH